MNQPSQTLANIPQMRPTPRRIFAALSALSYWLMAVASSKNLGYEDKVPWFIHAIGLFAGLSYAVNIDIALSLPKPEKPSRIVHAIAVISAIAGASNFYSGGGYGAYRIGIPDPYTEPFALISYGLRAYMFYWSAVRSCHAISSNWYQAFRNGHYAEIARISVALLTAGLYGIGISDSLFDVSFRPLLQVILFNNATATRVLAIIFVMLGSPAGMLYSAFWTWFGMQELFCGKPNRPDRYTFLGVLLCSAMLLPILGGASSKTGQVITLLIGFEAARALKITASIPAALIGGFVGYANILRPKPKPTLSSMPSDTRPPAAEGVATPAEGDGTPATANPIAAQQLPWQAAGAIAPTAQLPSPAR